MSMVLTGPGIQVYRAIAIKRGLQLYSATRIKPNTLWTPTAMLRAAGAITGHKYGRGEYERAITDLARWITAQGGTL